MTAQEREVAIGLLTRSRQTLLDAIAGVSDAQSRWQPLPGRWTILEYTEHLAISDDKLVALVERSLRQPPIEETDDARRARDQRLRETKIPRGVNQAPEMLRPTGRFATLAEAVDAFLAARERTLEYARTSTAELRKHFTPHPVLGPMDGYQWLTANARHVELHAGHIREIREMAGFPR